MKLRLFIFWMVFIFGSLSIVTIILGFTSSNNNCQSDNEKYTKTGIVDYAEWYGGTIGIYFKDGSQVYFSGSPNAKYDLLEMENLLANGVNYTFYYHRDCVMSDGNTVYWYEGNVIDKIKVNQ